MLVLADRVAPENAMSRLHFASKIRAMCREALMKNCKDCGGAIDRVTPTGRIPTTCTSCAELRRKVSKAKWVEGNKPHLRSYRKVHYALQAGKVAHCANCGCEFVHKQTSAKFCSRKCRIDAQREARKRYICQCCGVSFVPKQRRYWKYCSRECAIRDISAWFVAPRRSRVASYSLVYFRTCRACGEAFTTRSSATTACIPCAEAGVTLRLSARPGKYHVERAKRAGVEYENVDVIGVFERDLWTCKICGCPTPATLRGTYATNAPELDHVIPLSKGGTHTADNVQCACRKCNREKGANFG